MDKVLVAKVGLINMATWDVGMRALMGNVMICWVQVWPIVYWLIDSLDGGKSMKKTKDKDPSLEMSLLWCLYFYIYIYM